MKIVAVYNPESGGSYHRVKLWSEFVENVHLVQDLTEEIVQDCNILYIHWNSKTPVTQLSIWREKYKFRIIADIDDTWNLPKSFDGSVFLSQHLCLLADQVICSVESLVPDIMEWNKNVKVIPNYLPIGHGQFTLKPKTHLKIRVGIGGSISHFDDYMSLKGVIKQLERSDWFNKNCEFVIIGYNNLDWRWQKVASMFKKVKLFRYTSPENYMKLYDELDVMLLPLINNEINQARSNLKVWECRCKGVYPIISKMYLGKDSNNDLAVEDWINNIKSYVDSPKSYKYEFPDYKKECVNTRLELFYDLVQREELELNHDLYSIRYLLDQDIEYKELFNARGVVSQKTYLFEYNPIIAVVDKNSLLKDDYVAFFSHKFPHKTGIYKKYVEEILNNEDSDVVILCRQFSNYFEWTEQQHPGFMDLFIKICQRLELVIPPEYPVVYSNFFAAKANIYKEWVKVLQQAIDIMETDPEIRDLCWKNSGYEAGLNSEDLKKYTGLDYYPFHTFILERLISVWIVNKQLTYAIYN
jgi:hypothetical protein